MFCVKRNSLLTEFQSVVIKNKFHQYSKRWGEITDKTGNLLKRKKFHFLAEDNQEAYSDSMQQDVTMHYYYYYYYYYHQSHD